MPIVYVLLPSVSTHSRPKAAEFPNMLFCAKVDVSTHSRPKAAGHQNLTPPQKSKGFNTQPPEGGWPSSIRVPGRYIVSTHSRPKAAGISPAHFGRAREFQHTAARRRLG